MKKLQQNEITTNNLYFILLETILYGHRMSDSPDISESSSGVSSLNFQKDLRQRCHESLTCPENGDPGTSHWVEEKDNRSRKISSEGDVPLCSISYAIVT